MSAPIEVVFLDAAGTLFHVAEPVGVTYARLASEHGVEVDPAAMDHAFRCTWKELPPVCHPEGQLPGDDDRSWWRELVDRSFEKVLEERLTSDRLEELFTTLYNHYSHARAWHLYEDVVPALDAMVGHVRLFVLSNFDRRLRRILSRLGIGHVFESVIISSEVGAAKPHPRMFQEALRCAAVPADRCLHAGDEEKADILGAQAAGMHAIHIKRPEVTLLDVARKVSHGEF